MSLVNLYLHGFPNPKIYEYDTLTDDEKWSENFDVILANPPFMTPKGGIIPHNKFSISAKRSEILFVDYITSHLNKPYKGGIIVPDGVLHNNYKAYKEVRKNLINNKLI
jgi:type I restriction enzyme M protein